MRDGKSPGETSPQIMICLNLRRSNDEWIEGGSESGAAATLGFIVSSPFVLVYLRCGKCMASVFQRWGMFIIIHVLFS